MKQAPIFTKTYSFISWLLDHLEKVSTYCHLKDALGKTGLRFLEAITLALKGGETSRQIQEADDRLAFLKILLRLAEEKKLLSTRQYGFALENLEDIGRQLGSWRKTKGC